MNTQHWILVAIWVLYSALHSLLADARVKDWFKKLMGEGFRYYRLSYSLFAAVSLFLLLWYQFSINSIILYHYTIIRFGLSFLLIIPGIIIMTICIRKYFYDLSGIQALQKDKPPITPTLQQNGLHKLVRHPLYFGTLLFVWGLLIMFPLLSNLMAAIVLTVYVIVGINLEEKKLLLEYGDEYLEYSTKVPKLIPKF